MRLLSHHPSVPAALTYRLYLAEVPTFLVAGHETTASATTWCLGDLSQSPAVLAKLREELFSIPTDTPTMEQLNALPYLDLVVRESLRMHPVIANTARAAERAERERKGRERGEKADDPFSRKVNIDLLRKVSQVRLPPPSG